MADSGPPPSNVISLEAERERRQGPASLADHLRGEAFQWLEFEVDDHTVGLIEGDMPVAVLLYDMEGFCMSTATARELGRRLLEAADSPHVHVETTKP